MLFVRATSVFYILNVVTSSSVWSQYEENYQNNPADYYQDSEYQYEESEYIYEGNRDNLTSSAEVVQRRNPKFVTNKKMFMINDGGTIKLPCEVDNLDGFMLIWMKDDKVLALGDQVLEKDSRYQIESDSNGNSLRISWAEYKDAGEYTCQVNTPEKETLTHTVNIRVAPEVRASPSILKVTTGESAVLKCQIIKGNPKPQIYWTRKLKKFRSGELRMEGDEIELAEVTRQDQGYYTCHGHNGWEYPNNSTVQLQVLHPPHIDRTKLYIHLPRTDSPTASSSGSDEVEVTCIVHANPPAEVTWFGDGVQLDPSEHVMSRHGIRHTLHLTNIGGRTPAVGNYTCRATNRLGTAERWTEVSGCAEPVVFTTDNEDKKKKMVEEKDKENEIEDKEDEEDKVYLSWLTHSNWLVDNFRVEYSTPDHEWNTVYVKPLEGEQVRGKYFGEAWLPQNAHTVRVESSNVFGWSSNSPEHSLINKQEYENEEDKGWRGPATFGPDPEDPENPDQTSDEPSSLEPDLGDEVPVDRPKFEPSTGTVAENGVDSQFAGRFSLLILLMINLCAFMC